MNDLPDHVQANREYWNDKAPDWVVRGEESWAAEAPFWGIWRLPESEVRMLPDSMQGMRTIELGCGTGYVSGWMVRRGADAVAIDISEAQLATAKRLAAGHGVSVRWRHGSAEVVPEPDGSFDFAISEYGAAIWCDPYRWVPEARRLLKTGGRLVFLGNAPWAQVCTPADGSAVQTQLHRSYFDLHRLDWRNVEVDPGGVEFNLPISKWMALFREVGFAVEDYQELAAPQQVAGEHFYVAASWAQRWPSEHVWKLRAV